MSPVLGNVTRGSALRAAVMGVAVSFGGLLAAVQPATAATETLVYSFNQFPDAISPAHGLVKGPDGFFYGATFQGGTGPGLGNGAVFQLKPPTVGHPAWTESVIWNFKGGTKGKWPNGPLIFGADGTAYGVARSGGDVTDCNGNGCGIAYSIVPPAPGKKLGVFKVIHNFHSPAGSSPTGALTFDGAGNLYGATMYGGDDKYCTGDKGGCGVIFRLNPPAAGKVAWPQTTLYRFQHAVGAVPNGGLIFDPTENALYGTSQGGGTAVLNGVVFRLAKPAPGHFAWTYSVLHNFLGAANADGSQPNSGPTLDVSGNLYATTFYGGDSTCAGGVGCGTIVKLASGTWTETILHNFTGGFDGRNPMSGLTAVGNDLYGTTENGAKSLACSFGCGSVFKVDLATPAYSILYRFAGDNIDGTTPQYANLLWDGVSTLYGTASAGGAPSFGAVYALTLP